MSIQQHQVADDLSPDTAARARITTQRADRLREFIFGHLPEDVTVDAVISSGVQTAAVLPTDVEAIVSSDATDIERAQAEQFLAGVDADYLVLVTGNEADLTRIPLNDQLTADHAHQFGLSFHELLHILKTAIATIGQLIEEEVDEQYHEQVHDLINIIEDGAIESEAIHGDNFSNNAGIRLELTRRIHSQTPEDIPDGEEVHYSFWDAVTSCLYDEAIYPTGTTEVLLDEDDSRVQFKSDADRTAFDQIHSELYNLSRDALAIRSADRSDTTHSHDKTASIRRARRVIETWKTHIQPVLEADTNEEEEEEEEAKEAQGQGQANQQGGEGESQPQPQSSDGEEDQSDEATGQPGPASHPDGDGDTSSRNEGLQDGTQDSSPDAGPVDELPEDFDPSGVSLSREATDDSRQNVFEQPQITTDPDLDEVDDTDSEDPRDFQDSEDSKNDEDIDDTEGHEKPGSEGEDKSTSTSETDGTQDVGDESQSESGADSQSKSEPEAESEPSNRAEVIAQAADRVREREQGQHQNQDRGTETGDHETSVPSPGSGSDDTETEDPPQSAASSSINNDRRDGQTQNLTLGDFSDRTDSNSESDDDETSESGDLGTQGEHDEQDEQSDQSDNSEPENEQDETEASELDAQNTAESGETNQTEPEPEPEPESESESETPETPAHAETSNRAPEEEEAAYEDALASDERAAHDEADREGIDQQALDDELSALADQLDRSDSGQAQSDQDNENSDQSGGSRGGPGSLDELNILPISEDIAPPREWAAIEDGADQVAATLEMYLRLDRRKSVRRGLSAGAYDTRAGHRLAIGNPRVCKSRTLGNEKQYALVLVLDRSTSMRHGSPPKIEIATQALAQFTLAAENLGIRVAIIDFIDGEARLVKPFSVETRHVQTTLLDESCGGGTPLSDAIGLARELIEAQRDEPLVITVTDDNPSSTDDVIDQIRRSHAPVCSLTVATDCEPGTLSDSASELARYYERQEAVYTPDRLDDRLDQFASLLGGL